MHYQQNFGHETVNDSSKYHLGKSRCDKKYLDKDTNIAKHVLVRTNYDVF